MSRESDRRAWRERVARAAEAVRVCDRRVAAMLRSWDAPFGERFAARFDAAQDASDARSLLRMALRDPKPWARPRAGADLGKCDCLRRGRECSDYCRLDGTCPECWNDRRGVRPHSDDGKGEGDECPTASSYAIGDSGDYGWSCGCDFVKCPRRCGGTPPKEARARLRRKRRAAQRRRR